MATEVYVRRIRLKSGSLVVHCWAAEYDGFEGLGQTPDKAISAFLECLLTFYPRDTREFVLPRRIEQRKSDAAA